MYNKKQEICARLRNIIVSDCKNNQSYRNIAQKYNVSKSSVHKIYKKYLEHGRVDNLRGRGRKRNTSAYEDGRIVRVSRRNPTITSRNIVEQLRLNVSSRTVRRRLKEVGLKSCVAKPSSKYKKRNV